MRPNTVAVRVPGSTSNCGAGFDTLGLALTIYNRVELSRDPGASPAALRPSDARADAMVAETARAFFQETKQPAFGFTYRIDGDVPPARGLGSSVTVIAGVLAGLNELSGAGLSRHQLVEIGTALEGHPDNASAGILGGFCVSRCDPQTGRYRGTVRLELPSELCFVVVSPSLETLTKESRGVLPASLPYFDAVRSINSASYLVAALMAGEYDRLKDAVADFMHEPYRLPRIAGASAAIEAGVQAGGLTGWLSGSGSSVLCVSRGAHTGAVTQAMLEAFKAKGVTAEGRVLQADNRGLYVEPRN